MLRCELRTVILHFPNTAPHLSNFFCRSVENTFCLPYSRVIFKDERTQQMQKQNSHLGVLSGAQKTLSWLYTFTGANPLHPLENQGPIDRAERCCHGSGGKVKGGLNALPQTSSILPFFQTQARMSTGTSVINLCSFQQEQERQVKAREGVVQRVFRVKLHGE
jgi:hypothetical protein